MTSLFFNYVLKEVNGERKMVYETIPWPKNPGPMNLIARFIYAEYGGFATETEVRGHVRVNASEGTVVYDNNWMEWKNHNEIKQIDFTGCRVGCDVCLQGIRDSERWNW